MDTFDYKKYLAENKLLKEELNYGDKIEINPNAYPNYEFPYGTTGIIQDIDKADYASDDVVYTVKLNHIDPQGDEGKLIYVENPTQMNEIQDSEEKIKQAVRNFYSEKSKEDLLDEIFTILDMFLKEKGLTYDDMARGLKAKGHDIDIDSEELEEQTRNPMPRYELKRVFSDADPNDVQKVKDGYYGIGDNIMTLSDGLGTIEDKVSARSLDDELSILNRIQALFNQSRIGEIL